MDYRIAAKKYQSESGHPQPNFVFWFGEKKFDEFRAREVFCRS